MLAITSVIVDYMFKIVFNFLYSTGGAPKRCGTQINLLPYSTSRRAWVR